MEDELPHLKALLEAAEAIGDESKILRIGEIIDTAYPDRSVLLFTEYKATQALVVSTLMARFGEDAVGFINGDDRLPGVCPPSGKEVVLTGAARRPPTHSTRAAFAFSSPPRPAAKASTSRRAAIP